ncbi:MAG: ferritin-like domain-containing protein [Trebonia sp.]
MIARGLFLSASRTRGPCQPRSAPVTTRRSPSYSGWRCCACSVHTTCETFADEDLEGMLRDNLTAERIAITTYQEIIRWLGGDDPTTRRLLGGILADEEEHADDPVDLLGA